MPLPGSVRIVNLKTEEVGNKCIIALGSLKTTLELFLHIKGHIGYKVNKRITQIKRED